MGERKTLVLGCSGSVACIKIPEICRCFHEAFPEWTIVILPTLRAHHFISLPPDGVFSKDTNSERIANNLIGKVTLIEPETHFPEEQLDALIKSAGVVLVAPLGANLMAKMASKNFETVGSSANPAELSENLMRFLHHFTSPTQKHQHVPLLVAPAMNPTMWNSVVTMRHLVGLYEKRVTVLPTVSKMVMCGETGFGGMASPAEIVEAMQKVLLGEQNQQSSSPENRLDYPQLSTPLFGVGLTSENDGNLLRTLRLQSWDNSDFSKFLELAALSESDRSTDINVLFAGFGLLCGTPENKYSDLFVEDLRMFTALAQNINRKYICEMSHSIETIVDVNLESSTDFDDAMEWRLWRKRGDPVLHIWLRQWATVLVIISPTDVVVAKILSGRCDTLLTCVVRAWDFHKGAFIIYHKSAVLDENVTNSLRRLGFAVARVS